MNARIIRRTLAVVAGATLTLGIAGTAIVGADDGDPVDVGVPIDAVDRSSIAAWADTNGYTGLSPASLAVIATPLPPDEVADLTVLSEIAAWADENGYTGLSPAGLRPTD